MIPRKVEKTSRHHVFDLSRRLRRQPHLTESLCRRMHEIRRAILKKLARQMSREHCSDS